VDTAAISRLLRPYLSEPALTPGQLQSISTYIDLLLRWNQRINLTAIREPEEIVTRHFGESLFAARHLFPHLTAGARPAGRQRPGTNDQGPTLADLGSGAGFPGLPIKIWAPGIHLTLIESNQKKATFLREVARALTLTDIDVIAARAEDVSIAPAEVVTLRAVERFTSVLPTAARLVAPAGRLALLIGESQFSEAKQAAPELDWQLPMLVPGSSSRILAIGTNPRLRN